MHLTRDGRALDRGLLTYQPVQTLEAGESGSMVIATVTDLGKNVAPPIEFSVVVGPSPSPATTTSSGHDSLPQRQTPVAFIDSTAHQIEIIVPAILLLITLIMAALRPDRYVDQADKAGGGKGSHGKSNGKGNSA